MPVVLTPPADEHVLATLARIHQSDDGKKLVEYLEQQIQAQHEANAVDANAVLLHQGQGAAQVLLVLTASLKGAREALTAIRAGSNTPRIKQARVV